MSSKGAIGSREVIIGNLHDILQLQMESKKRVLGVFISYIKTYTRNLGVADEEQ